MAESDKYYPNPTSYGSTVNNMMNGSNNGKDQINPPDLPDGEKYASPSEVPVEKDLAGLMDEKGE